MRPVRALDVLSAERVSDMVAEHIQIAELVLTGRLQVAHDTLVEHIVSSQEVVLERAQRALSMAKLGMAVRS